jgi:hypothetical protein
VTGHAVKGYSGFLPKDGANFTRRLNVRLHDDDVSGIESVRRSGEAQADVVRLAIREYVLRHKENR